MASVSEERVIQDAFSELFVATGADIEPALRPPPLWKTAVLTVIPLFIIVWQVGGNLAPYVGRSGQLPPLVVTLVVIAVAVSFNSYIGVPLVHSMFGDWLLVPRPAHPPAPYSYIAFLDSGISSKYVQVLLVLIFYGLNIGFGLAAH